MDSAGPYPLNWREKWLVERIDERDARIEALTAERDQARAKAIADVVVWLRGKCNGYPESAGYEYAATALETGEWEN